jgi:hypothetical protein
MLLFPLLVLMTEFWSLGTQICVCVGGGFSFPSLTTYPHIEAFLPCQLFSVMANNLYGPHRDLEKEAFFHELRRIQWGRLGPWLLCGDFNLIYKAEDKNNLRLNHCLMSKFHPFLQETLGVSSSWAALYVEKRAGSSHSISCIDRAFAYLSWCYIFPHHRIHTISLNFSDLALLVLHTKLNAPSKKCFKFESTWLKFPGYLEAMAGGF